MSVSFLKRLRAYKYDRFLLINAIILIVFGLIVFFSSSLGLLARDGASISRVLGTQLGLGLLGGLLTGFVLFLVPPQFLQRYSLYFFIFALLLTVAVFIPGLGFEWAGAKRWLSLGPFTFQPGELLKIATIIFTASWLSVARNEVQTIKYGVVPLLGILTVTGAPLLLQPDNATFLILFVSVVSMFLVGGGRIKHLLGLGVLAVMLFAVVAYSRPYVMSRIMTFINPSADTLGASYQVRQSLVAIGSGGVFGRGFGQSVQKFQYLPEPTGDSIFAVLGEEFGFLGTSGLTILFLSFGLRGLYIARRAQRVFSRLLTTGLVIMIVFQAFLNMAAMVGIFPLTGVTLVFVSHGGSSLLFSIAAVGLVLGTTRVGLKSL